ncbi:Protein of unknown function [Terrisporobacter glycolicus]|nr:Protein of unknown function [Terrisporobacter glycolicus]
MIKLSEVFKEIFVKAKSLPFNVYDEVPQNATNPHIRLDYSYELDNRGKNYDGKSYYQYIHVFSNYKGRREVLEITDKIIELFSEDIKTENLIMYPKLIRNEILIENDECGEYRHSVIIYKFDIYEKRS